MSVLGIDPATFGQFTEWSVPSLDGSPAPAGTAPVDGAAPAEGVAGVTGVDGTGSAGSGSGESFGDVLSQQISNLSDLQQRAADASTALANGTAPDAASVVIAVEKAQLAMQLAGQLRTRAAEAVNDIFHTQI